MPYVLMSRWEKRKLAQFKDNLKINSVYNVQIKRGGVCSPGTLHNLNFKKRIREFRKKGKKDF
jgi:hypothetical protein